MTQKYKVYINDKVIIFRKSYTTLSVTENQLISVEPSSAILKEIISIFENNYKAKKLFIITSDPKNAFREFSMDYSMVIAAGGIVRNPQGDVLFIFRNGKWDLPKGKKDMGETPRQTALREVSEETGIKDLAITKKLENTYHTYKENKQLILKKTFWYEMLSHEENLTPQKEEEITEVRWVKTFEIAKVLENTFGSVSDLLSEYRKVNRF
jgi:8-oxo-dGTP pyrophosphatase MutT (NUDIX family)